MPTIRVRSTDGLDADDGSTWALAKATIGGATAIDAAGDTIVVSQAHAESTAATVSVSMSGTPANPVRIICANDSADPPTAVATTGTITTTGAFGINIAGSGYIYGLTFNGGTGASAASIAIAQTAGTSEVIEMESCKVRLLVNATNSNINIGVSTSTVQKLIRWRNVDVRVSNAAQRVYAQGISRFIWEGGTVESGSATNTGGLILVGNNGRGGDVEVSGVNFSNLSSLMRIFDGGSTFIGTAKVRNCRLPTGVGSAAWLSFVPTSIGFRAEAYDCAVGDTHFAIATVDYAGETYDERTVVRTGGAQIGGSGYALRMVSSANANYLANLRTVEHHIANSAVGSAVTIEAEIITDNVTLTDQECWLEVQVKNNAGFAQSSVVTDRNSNPLASGVAQDSSTTTWTTTGLTTPVKQKLSVTVTPQEAGTIVCAVVLARPSTTVFVDLPRKL